MKKIGSLFLLLCVLNLFALLGLGGYLLASGRLDKTKATAIADLLRHKGTPEKFRETLYDILEPAPATTSAPASQPAVADSNLPDPQFSTSAQDRIDAGHQAMEQERLKLENQAQELRHRQDLLVQLQVDVQAKLKKIDEQQQAFEKRVAAANAGVKDDSFQKSLALYDELKTKQVKDIFLGMAPDIVANYLQAMEPSRAGKIIGEFKSPAESAFIASVLDRIRAAGTTSAIGSASNGTPAVAARP